MCSAGTSKCKLKNCLLYNKQTILYNFVSIPAHSVNLNIVSLIGLKPELWNLKSIKTLNQENEKQNFINPHSLKKCTIPVLGELGWLIWHIGACCVLQTVSITKGDTEPDSLHMVGSGTDGNKTAYTCKVMDVHGTFQQHTLACSCCVCWMMQWANMCITLPC